MTMTIERVDGVVVVPREEFARDRFDYKPGQHVVFAGPTQRGKTTLAFDLLNHVATPELPAYVAVSKPRDKVTEQAGRRMGFRRVDEWPVPKKVSEFWDGKPRGYLIWPKFGDIDVDTDHAAEVTARLLADRYAAGVKGKQGILVMDDTMVKAKVMGLDRQMTTILAMAGAMGIGEWVFVQKPTQSGNTAIWSYSQCEHLFLIKDPDAQSRKRYDEIGGFDPKYIANLTTTLTPYQAIYLKRTEGYVCIVDKS